MKPDPPTFTVQQKEDAKKTYALKNRVANSKMQSSGNEESHAFKFINGRPKIILTSQQFIDFLSANASQISFEIKFSSNKFGPTLSKADRALYSKLRTSTADEIIFKKSHKDIITNYSDIPMDNNFIQTPAVAPVVSASTSTPTAEKILVVTGNWLNKQDGEKKYEKANADSLYIINNHKDLTNLLTFTINTETEIPEGMKPDPPTFTVQQKEYAKKTYVLKNRVANSKMQSSGDEESHAFKFIEGKPKIILTSQEFIEFLSANASQISFEIKFSSNKFGPTLSKADRALYSKLRTSPGEIEFIFKI